MVVGRRLRDRRRLGALLRLSQRGGMAVVISEMCSHSGPVACCGQGVVVFVGKPARPLLAGLGAAIWAAGLWRADLHYRIAEISAVSAIYEAAAGAELFRYNRIQGQRLVSSQVTAWIIALQAALDAALVIGAPFLAVDEVSFIVSPYMKYRFLELSGFIAILGFLLAMLSKERLASRREIAAMIDPLTGLPNRRAFDRAVERAKRSALGAGDRGARLRSRQFQIYQRSLRPCGRRPRACRFRRDGDAQCSIERHAGAHRRRGVRRHPLPGRSGERIDDRGAHSLRLHPRRRASRRWRGDGQRRGHRARGRDPGISRR